MLSVVHTKNKRTYKIVSDSPGVLPAVLRGEFTGAKEAEKAVSVFQEGFKNKAQKRTKTKPQEKREKVCLDPKV